MASTTNASLIMPVQRRSRTIRFNSRESSLPSHSAITSGGGIVMTKQSLLAPAYALAVCDLSLRMHACSSNFEDDATFIEFPPMESRPPSDRAVLIPVAADLLVSCIPRIGLGLVASCVFNCAILLIVGSNGCADCRHLWANNCSH